MDKLTHEQCCALVEKSIERGLQALEHIKKRLRRGACEDWVVKSNCDFASNILCNINHYGAYLHGMTRMLVKLRENGLIDEKREKNAIPRAKGDSLIYNKAIIDFLLADKTNCERFIGDDFDQIRFTDHEYDKKGRLVKCRAYFAKKVTTYTEDK